jgi:hypothetical protein
MTKTNSSEKPTKGSIVEQFADLKDRKIPEGAEHAIGSTADLMLKVFQTYPTVPFTQADFVQKLNISNPFCNHQLHALMDKGLISRVGSRRKYWYTLVQ